MKESFLGRFETDHVINTMGVLRPIVLISLWKNDKPIPTKVVTVERPGGILGDKEAFAR